MSKLNRTRRGLTLIELVVVLGVLATLAAIVVPRLDFVKGQADRASAASNNADLVTLLQTHKLSTGKYPQLDLLVDSAGTAYSKMWNTDGSSPFTVTTLDGAMTGSGYYRSLLEGGLTTGLYNDSAYSNASNSDVASTAVDLVSAGAAGTLKVAELTTASTNVYKQTVFDLSFPNTAGVAPTGVKLIGMGIGYRNGLNGSVMASTPLQTDNDDPKAVYCRYIAIFAIYNDGTPAQLKMVLDHRMKTIDKNLEQFKTQVPTT